MPPESKAGIDSERFTRSETYGKLREWAERLKKFEGVPEMYRDIPSYPESLTKEFERLNVPTADEGAQAAFLDRHIDYLDSVRRQVQLKDPGYLKTQQIIAENYDKYPGGAFSVGLDPAKELQLFSREVEGDAKPFSQGFMRPAHEIFGHLRPGLYGIQPAYDPVTVPGLPGTYKPSLISPTNESLAHFLNQALIRNLGASPETVKNNPALNKIRSALKGEDFPHFSTAVAGSRRDTRFDPDQILDISTAARELEQTPSKSPWLDSGIYSIRRFINKPPSEELLAAHPRLPDIVSALRGSNYLSQSDLLSPFDIPRSFRNVITDEFLAKYVDPTLRNFKEGLRISTPGFERYTDSSSAISRGLDPFDDNSNLAADKLATLTEFDPYKQYSSLGMMIFGKDPITTAAQGAIKAVKDNPYGTAGGAALTLLNDEVAKAIAKDDYKGAATAAAKDVLLGAAAEAGLKNVAAPLLQRAAPGVAARVIPAVAGAAQYGIPAAVGTGLFTQGRSGSALDTLVNKAATVVPGLKPNPKTDIGRRTGDAILNEGRYLLRSILQNRVPYLKGRLF